ncbi:unnamed protein product, partial [marine sediment metagenome]
MNRLKNLFEYLSPTDLFDYAGNPVPPPPEY